MKNLFLIGLFISLSPAFGQKNSNLSVEVNYGLNGNFFVRSYDELGGPSDKKYFYKKDFLGTIGGVELKYQLNESSTLNVGYARSINKGEKNYSGAVNGVDVFINNFNIRHTNDFYQLAYERRFKKSNPLFNYHLGIVLANMQQQEIQLESFSNQIIIDERNFKNSRLQEAGVFGGIHLIKKIDTKFYAGLRVRAYYLVSVQTLEAIVLTPTLSYRF